VTPNLTNLTFLDNNSHSI